MYRPINLLIFKKLLHPHGAGMAFFRTALLMKPKEQKKIRQLD